MIIADTWRDNMYCPLMCSICLLASTLMSYSLNWSIESFITLFILVAFTVFSSKVYLSRETRAELSATLDTGIHLLVSMLLEMFLQSIFRTEQGVTLTAGEFLIRMDMYMFEYFSSSGHSYYTLFAGKSTFQVHIAFMNL